MTEFEIPVNAKNPAEYFACIGLLELTLRVFGDAEGYFKDTEQGEVFVVRSSNADCTLSALLEVLCKTPLTQDDNDDLHFGDYLLLDWWKTNPYLKVWCDPQQQPHNFLRDAQVLMAPFTKPYDPLHDGKKVLGKGMVLLDARLRNDARDIGFSHYSLASACKQARQQYPCTLLLAFIGLQRSQPVVRKKQDNEASYWTWRFPIPVCFAQTCTWGLLPGYEKHHFLFQRSKYARGYMLVTFADLL